MIRSPAAERHVWDAAPLMNGMEPEGVPGRLTRMTKRWGVALIALASACGDSPEVAIESAYMYRGYDDHAIHLELASCVSEPSAQVRETARRVEIDVKRGPEKSAPCQHTLNVRLRRPFNKERELIDATTGRSVDMKFRIEG